METAIVKILLMGITCPKAIPARYRLGTDLKIFLSFVFPGMDLQNHAVYMNKENLANFRGTLDSFIPSRGFLHLVVVPPSLCESGSLSKDEFIKIVAKDSTDAKNVSLFLEDDPSNTIETVDGLYRIESLSLPFIDRINVANRIIGIERFAEAAIDLLWHDDSSLKVTRTFLKTDKDELVFSTEATRDIQLLKDIAPIDQEFHFSNIDKAVSSGPYIYISHRTGIEEKILKTFKTETANGDEIRYRDTGQRVVPMDILQTNSSDLSRQLLVRYSLWWEMGADPFEAIPGKIYDVIRTPDNEIYVLSWEKGKQKAHVYRVYGSAHETVKREFEFKFNLQPGALAYCCPLNLFIISAHWQNDIYCIDRAFADQPQNISLALSGDDGYLAAGGEIQDIYVANICNQTILFVIQTGKIRAFLIQRVYDEG